ncbi:MAG: NUMOD4 domain-containing protein [Ferruginibacter sp.]
MNTLSFAREEWKEVHLGEGFVNDFRLEVSNFGRIRAFNKINKGKILKGSMINGYRIIRMKMFHARNPESEARLKEMQASLSLLFKEVVAIRKELRNNKISPEQRADWQKKLEEAVSLQESRKKEYMVVYNQDLKSRTHYYAPLVHRLVAEYFIPRQSEEHTIVAHLDFDKLNNVVTNLKWMTPQENSSHQQLSPHVQADKEKKKQTVLYGPRTGKLTVTKVMFLKKLLNEGVSVKKLAKQFKVTETQIIRIKKNQNWSSVEAAK